MGFFYMVFPTNPIAIHDSWTNNLILKNSGGIVYSGEGIVQPWVFTRELDRTTTNGQIACFSLYGSDNYKDVGGYLDQPGQQTSVIIPEYTESMNATFQFDRKLGSLIIMTKSYKSHTKMSMMVQGNLSENQTDNDSEISIIRVSP